MQFELSTASQEKSQADVKLTELDQLVGQLLELNESLVSQLSGRPVKLNLPFARSTPKTSSTKKSVKKSSSVSQISSGYKSKKLSSSSSVPRAASVSTAASDASKTKKFRNSKINTLNASNMNDVEHLKELHKMYADMAKSVNRGMSPLKNRKKSPSRAKSLDNSMGSLNSKSRSTRMSGKKVFKGKG